jgi:hypothetical protein
MLLGAAIIAGALGLGIHFFNKQTSRPPTTSSPDDSGIQY